MMAALQVSRLKKLGLQFVQRLVAQGKTALG
jgi:hypothetical protein